jgi:transposase InsO family protein
MCEFFEVSTSGFYAWLNRPVSTHKQHDVFLKSLIQELHQGHRRCYGAERVHAQLRQRGYSCSKRRINRLMRELGIKAKSTGLYAWRPGQHEFYTCAGNKLRQEGEPETVGQVWVGDFTFIKTHTGYLHFAVVMDLFNRKVVGWSFSSKRNAELTKSALTMALQKEAPQKGCLFHSDQGIEYAAHEYRDLLFAAGMRRSMSRRATPLDNAAMESFFHTLKTELVQKQVFKDKIEAVARIVEYVEFYNRDRLHSALNFQSPENYGMLQA